MFLPFRPLLKSQLMFRERVLGVSAKMTIEPLDLLRSNLSRVQIPEPTNRIYKHECYVSFDSPVERWFVHRHVHLSCFWEGFCCLELREELKSCLFAYKANKEVSSRRQAFKRNLLSWL
ncbi:Ubiquitin carboxyl-terminal hydrolase 14 [Spatholobus suberectus]|nr:Ubiquitin carboxyl-terminal hydrolase 14 [Spatholobus suberectus]